MEEIKEGYKKTKIGVIPNNWEVKKIGQIAKITMGQSPKSISYNHEKIGIPLIQGNTDCKNRRTFPRIYTTQKTKECFIGDIIMTVRAPVGAISKSLHNACIGRGVCSIRFKEENDFLYHFLVNYEQKWTKYSQGSTFTAINSNDIKSLQIPLPPLQEQKKIAKILSTWDKAIEKQEKLIEAKEKLKKGLMQKFLNSNSWKYIKLNEVLYEHKDKSRGKEEVFSVSVSKGLVNQIEHLGRSFSAKDTSKYNLVRPNDIVYTKSPTGDFPYGIIKQNLSNKEVIVSPLYGVFKPKNHYIGRILHEYFLSDIRTNNYLKPIIQKGAKNTININNKTFLSRAIKLPLLEQEQQKIAKVLSTADKEIELLKKELEELKKQKKGLMQRLLSGEVRTINVKEINEPKRV